MFNHPSFDDHEEVAYFSDPKTGLRAIVALHSTHLGPGGGGVRMWDYASEDDALTDVLRLSQGMSYKNAMAGIKMGGGKGVILGDPKTLKTPALMQSFGRAIEGLGGRYVTAEDVGMDEADMAEVATQTRYVTGTDGAEASAGDPSPYTAHGIFTAMQAALQAREGSADFVGKSVAIQGVGSVGMHLAEEVAAAGARLVVSDVDDARVAFAKEKLGAQPVPIDSVLSADVDILAPCALGAVFDDETIPTLQCDIIVGGANNQLQRGEHGQAVMDRDILYVPDYIANAGGIMNCSLEYYGEFVSPQASMQWVEEIGNTTAIVLKEAARRNMPTNIVADEMAKAKIGRKTL